MIHDAVNDAGEAAIGPTFQHVSDVHDEIIGTRVNAVPTIPDFNLQCRDAVRGQEGQHAIILVSPDS